MKMRTNAILLLALVALTGCVNRAAQVQAKKTQALVTDTTIVVQAAPAVTMDLDENLDVTGAFATSQQSEVGPTVPGRLTAVYVRDGDIVHAGQTIAQQETDEHLSRLRQAQAQADSARSSLQQALSDAKVGPVKSEANLQAAQARLSQAKARYSKAKTGSRSEERAQAEWNVKKAKSDMDTAKAALDRANRLYAEGAIAKVDVENAENKYQNTLAAYEGALQNLSMVQTQTRPEDLQAAADDVRAAEEAVRVAKADQRLDVLLTQRVEGARANLNSAQESVRLAQIALYESTIRSPFSGRVSGKPLQAGTYASPGTPVATIVGGTGTYFEASVPESKVALIVPGAHVQMTVDALKGVKLTGTVIAVNPVASGQGRLFTVRISVNESTGTLKPGMFARAQIKLGERKGAVVVPEQAVIRDGENSYLFTVAGDKAKRIDIKLGLQTDGVIEVTGVNPGDKVVVSGQSGLVEGAKIKVEEAKQGA